MFPQLIYGGSQSDRERDVKSLFPSADYVYTHIVKEKTSITIKQVHDLITSLTAWSAMRARVVWIEEAQSLTIPAQNALLKILEEPPQSTQFVLTCTNKNSLLPTIVSRCQTRMVARESQVEVSGTELSLIKQALIAPSGERINLADSLGRKREDLVAWTERCLHDLSVKMQKEKSPRAIMIMADIARHVHSAHSDLIANVSPTLTMQHLFLVLPHSKKS